MALPELILLVVVARVATESPTPPPVDRQTSFEAEPNAGATLQPVTLRQAIDGANSTADGGGGRRYSDREDEEADANQAHDYDADGYNDDDDDDDDDDSNVDVVDGDRHEGGGHGGGGHRKKHKKGGKKKKKKKKKKGHHGLLSALKKMKKHLPDILHKMHGPSMFMMGMAQANFHNFVMHALMMSKMALASVVFMIVREMVFGDKDRPVKYYNFGYDHHRRLGYASPSPYDYPQEYKRRRKRRNATSSP